jgi:hypothetical protein
VLLFQLFENRVIAALGANIVPFFYSSLETLIGLMDVKSGVKVRWEVSQELNNIRALERRPRIAKLLR